MDRDDFEKLTENPKFISGIYNYCDRWCERCAFTSRCMNYAMGEEEFDGPDSQDIHNQALWDKLAGIFSTTLEMVREKAEEMGIDLDAIDADEIAEQTERIHEMAKEQPYSQAAMQYIQMADDWLKANSRLLVDKGEELESLAEAEIPGTRPDCDMVSIVDCIEVILWYQRQIYVKLCRAAIGTIRAEFEHLECIQEDADGSAKVAIIGIERSTAAWAALLDHLPDREQGILNLLVTLKHLLQQVDTAFPNARSFPRPGFDTTDHSDFESNN